MFHKKYIQRIVFVCVILLQAHYYEELEYCPESAWPNFAYDVVSLLSNINAAKLDAQYYSRRSSATLDIFIQVIHCYLCHDNYVLGCVCLSVRLCP